jgi:hypothetical protein
MWPRILSRSCQYNAEGQKHGWEIEYRKPDLTDVFFKTMYKNGKKHGDSYAYHENGSIWWHSTYVNGERHGPSSAYLCTRDGFCIEKSTYKNGKLRRLFKCNPCNGEIKEINYKDGKKHGDYKKYDKTKRLVDQRFYYEGERFGLTKIHGMNDEELRKFFSQPRYSEYAKRIRTFLFAMKLRGGGCKDLLNIFPSIFLSLFTAERIGEWKRRSEEDAVNQRKKLKVQ